jgi:MYXO-CTERM domain-containing protein
MLDAGGCNIASGNSSGALFAVAAVLLGLRRRRG